MTIILIIASILAVLCIHLNNANAYSMTGIETFKYVISDPFLRKMVGVAYLLFFIIVYSILYFIYWLTL